MPETNNFLKVGNNYKRINIKKCCKKVLIFFSISSLFGANLDAFSK